MNDALNNLHQRAGRRSWRHKFADAFRGVGTAIAHGNSFYVQFSIAGLVIVFAAAFRVSSIEWCILLLCITMVLAAETFNSALESLARVVDENHNPLLGKALDMASGAVLVCAMGAAAVGLIVFLNRLVGVLGWW